MKVKIYWKKNKIEHGKTQESKIEKASLWVKREGEEKGGGEGSNNYWHRMLESPVLLNSN